MTGGFMFDGVDIEDIGLEYAPDNRNTQVYNPADWAVHEQSFDGYNGGYFFGTTVKPKTFTLRCFYEDSHVSDGIMTKVWRTFKRGKTGRLVFKNRPWLWYNATVVDVDATNMLNYKNGIVTITLRAYYPFARCDEKYISSGDEWIEDKLNNSALMVGSQYWTNVVFATPSNHLTQNTTFYIANPGTERAAVSICIAGNVGSGVTIYNKATDQLCEIVALTDENTIDAGKYLKCNALNGQTALIGGASPEPAFLYHKTGFIELESSYPAMRNVSFSTTSGSNNIRCDANVNESLVGQRIMSDSSNFEAYITDVINNKTIVVDRNATSSKTYTGCIMPVNEIYVHSDGSFDLSLLRLDFNPTFA